MISLNAGSELINPGIGLIFWMTITFVILLFLLSKYAWKPILGAVKNRENAIKNSLIQAENARKEMQNLKADNEQLLKEARSERDAMMKEAREIREKMISQAKEDAKEEAQKLINAAKNSIKQEQQAALTELKSQVAILSIDIAQKVVQKELASDKNQLQLVENLLKEVTLN